jgi:hypothetical protein
VDYDRGLVDTLVRGDEVVLHDVSKRVGGAPAAAERAGLRRTWVDASPERGVGRGAAAVDYGAHAMNGRDARFLIACIWCGPIFALIFGIGFAVLAGFVPPPSPHDSAAQIARLFDSDSIRAGTVVMMAGTPFIGV